MITKVLIVEDQESANISVQKTMADLGITEIEHAYYCDDALERITQRAGTDRSYDLLITDLFFEPDDRKVTLAGGTDLIAAARKIQPDLKVLVFSAESKAGNIEMLYAKFDIDAYVRKARNDARELKEAICELAQHRRYRPRHISDLINSKNTYEFTDIEITIITSLAQGMLQKDIPDYLKANQLKPSGLSSVEKS
ncbi:response regulator [Paraflavitalea speifideaquila]|uniref:response regulator n=1 Tax=Paraflavitalea speifideaquila TaxID=3076558 RepID=UPI0028E7B8E1|nr:response regulator [Paraflavitalea speifideiaquila]